MTPEERKIYKRQWSVNNRDRFRAYQRKYYIKNRSTILAKSSLWKKRNRDKVCLYSRRDAAKNQERIKEYKRKTKEVWLRKQRERRLRKRKELIALGLKKEFHRSDKTGLTKAELIRAWRIKNRVHIRNYAKNRRRQNPQLAIKHRMASRIRSVLKRRGLRKGKPTLFLIGTNAIGLKRHIESLFKPGMSWDNRRLWHIDHKRPCSSFDLTDEAQQLQCFHYTNLQPLWWWENLHKSDKVEAA